MAEICSCPSLFYVLFKILIKMISHRKQALCGSNQEKWNSRETKPKVKTILRARDKAVEENHFLRENKMRFASLNMKLLICSQPRDLFCFFFRQMCIDSEKKKILIFRKAAQDFTGMQHDQTWLFFSVKNKTTSRVSYIFFIFISIKCPRRSSKASSKHTTEYERE